MIENFTYHMTVDVVFKEHAITDLCDYIQQQNIQKPMLISDSFLITTNFGKEIQSMMKNAVIYTDVEVNPSIRSVDQCAAICKEQHCDGIVVLGGGSCIDTAKACSVVAVHEGSVKEFLDGNPHRKDINNICLPVIAIPTTSGTGSEVSRYAVVTDTETLRKDSITSSYIYPKVSLVDPIVTLGLPRALTISTGLDVLSHALESLLSMLNNPLTDVLALEAIRLVFENLSVCVKKPIDIEARKNMCFASTLAGIAMSHCCGTLPHGMGCPLSGHFNVPHGLAVGVLQKYALLYLGHECDDVILRVMKAIDPQYQHKKEDAKNDLIQKIDDLFEELECPKDLSAYHLDDEGIKKMVEDASIHGCTSLNPRKVNKKEITEIYESLKGNL